MQASSRALVESTFDTSNPGHLHFGELSGVLMRAQVESHHMDHRSGRTSCHFPDGETLDLAFDWPQDGIADTFEGDAVGRAIRRAQRGRVRYPEFKRVTHAAGCATSLTLAARAIRTSSGSRTDAKNLNASACGNRP